MLLNPSNRSDAHIIALRRALIAAETENANLRHQLLEAEADRAAAKALLIATTEPRQELQWPCGCLSVRACRELKECSSGCAVHSGRPIRSTVEAWQAGWDACE